MVSTAQVPQLDTYVPDLMDFICATAHAFQDGSLNSWQDLTTRVQAFFTPAMLDRVDARIPGWRAMSGYADGVTLVHVMCVFTALLNAPDYRRATASDQALMQWIVVFHDLAKQVYPGQRDHTHSFRSAALTGAILPQVGFATTDEYQQHIDEWMALTCNAVTHKAGSSEPVQDNDQLPAILAGITRLFGHNTPAALIVKTVLLHQSITVVDQWPQAAPLSTDEVSRYLDHESSALLRIMMLVDNDGWNLFDPPTKERYHQATERVFDTIQSALSCEVLP